MKEYKYYVDLCGGSCGGVMTIKAKDADDAYMKAMEDVGKRLYQAFPDLDIEYNVEIIEDEGDEE